MDFPCPSCGAVTPFAGADQDPAGLIVCVGCARQIRVAVRETESTVDQEEYRRAELFARQNKIDLATAYSVLEGLFTLEEALGGVELPLPPSAILAEPRPPAKARSRFALDAESTHPADTPLYDPGFTEAVRDGCLTVQQAIERGDRMALAARLATRHLLPMNLALLAADHRITIRQAILQRAAHVEQARPEPEGAGWVSAVKVAAFLGGVAAVLALAAVSLHTSPRPSGAEGSSESDGSAASPPEHALLKLLPDESDRTKVGTTTSKSDTEGRLLQVIGPDPRSVLVGFCTSGRRSDLKDPVGIAELDPPSVSERLGIFRNNALSNLPSRAIRIRKDDRTGDWIAGDGAIPIPSEAVGATSPAPASSADGKPGPVTSETNAAGSISTPAHAPGSVPTPSNAPVQGSTDSKASAPSTSKGD